MKVKSIVSFIALVLFLAPTVFSQSRETGAVVGTVMDEEKTPLPGVTVTLSSPNLMGARTSITTTDGSYRFPALPPGEYTLKAELPGFATVVRENIRLETTIRLTLDITMKQAVVAEEVTVVALSPTVDIKSTETASVTLTNEILRNIPYSQFTSDIVNLAPAVNDNVAYGASQNTGIAYTVDGVNVADPEAGSAWVFLDHNIIEEAKIMGIGLPAEYGNFTGVIFNLITKSGGNEFSGHVEFNFQGRKKTETEKGDWPNWLWQTENNQAYLDDFPELSSPRFRLMDMNAHLGGPIKKDKLWFYTGAQYYRSMDWATGFPEARDYKQPRWFGKITSQLAPATNMNFSLEVDTYDGINRGASATTSPEACVNQKSPEVVGNLGLTHILSPKTFIDLKAAYFWGYYYLDPEVGPDISGHFDGVANMLYDSAGYFFYADRTRLQVNASFTHFAEDFIQGNHDFKFGVEAERSMVRNRYGYTGPTHSYYWDYYGPYLRYQYEGYDTNTRYTRVEGFIQDAWQITPRLNINLGARFGQNWGTIKDVDGVVYSTSRIAPRIGFTYDILGDKTTVFKAHYGQFTEAMLSSYHDRLNPASAYNDYISYYWDTGLNDWVEFDRVVHEELYKLDDKIKHPYLSQFTASIERDIFKDASLSLTFIYRKWNNIIGRIDTLADYNEVSVNVPDLGQTFTVYERTAATVGSYAYELKNIQQGDPWISLDPYRKYWGLEFLFNKRFSNRWQLLLSYVYSQATGTMDNGFADDIGWGGSTDDPNFWIKADGHSTSDPTHMLKVQGTVILPFDIAFNAYFRAITGDAWTTRFRTSRFNQGRITFFCEDRGTNHYPMEKLLDIRLEKIFTLAAKYRLGLIIDVFNVLNADTITNWGTRIGYDWILGTWPSTDGHDLYSIVRPRQGRVGIRLIF